MAVHSTVDPQKVRLDQNEYQTSWQTPEVDPTIAEKVETWVARAKRATSLGEVLACLNRVHFLNPHHQDGKRLTYEAVRRLLEQNPFLAYRGENDGSYVVSDGAELTLMVPKDRAVLEPYPPRDPKPLTPAFHLLRWASLGLLVAGIGTLIFAPLAALWALQIYLQRPLNQADRVRFIVILIIAGGLLGLALILNFLFLLHL